MITKAQLQGGDPFKFWVPLDTIEKATDKKTGKVKMVVKGIASTDDVDSDEEVLKPKGFELDHLMNYGFINWHHQSKKTPRAIIGEPIKAEIVNKGKGLYVEAELYDTELGRAVYDFANTLQKSGSKRKLGWSIEGKALYRDPNNDKIVEKAAITDIAITPAPKNKKTFVDVVKGHFSNEDWEFEVDDNDNLIDVVRPNGDQLVISKGFEINIVKAQDTVNTAPLIKESLEGSEKKSENSDSKKDDEEEVEKLTIKKDMEHTTEQISKAAEILGMNVEDLQKGLQTKSEAIAQSALEKADKMKKEEEEEEEEEEETEKAQKPTLQKGSIAEQIAEKEAEIEALKKAEEEGRDPLLKAMQEQTSMLGSFITKAEEREQELSKGIQDLNERFSEIEERLEQVESTPTGRKSVTAKPLTKGEVEDEGEGTVLSLSRNKAEILDHLEVKSGLTKGDLSDRGLAEAMAKFESTNMIDRQTARRLQLEDNITLVP